MLWRIAISVTITKIRHSDIKPGLREQLNNNFDFIETSKVPYTGATDPVNLGSQKLITETIESVGDLTVDCGTNKTIVLQESVWEDLRFPATLVKLGANTKPDFDYTNLGLLFPQNDTGEVASIIAQMPHSYKLGTNIYPHIHFIQTASNVPVFKISYRWYLNGTTPPSFTTITSTTVVHTYTSGSILQRLAFPAISGSGITAISSILDIKVYRDDNVVTGDVLVKEFDIHYTLETIGSRSMTAK